MQLVFCGFFLNHFAIARFSWQKRPPRCPTILSITKRKPRRGDPHVNLWLKIGSAAKMSKLQGTGVFARPIAENGLEIGQTPDAGVPARVWNGTEDVRPN